MWHGNKKKLHILPSSLLQSSEVIIRNTLWKFTRRPPDCLCVSLIALNSPFLSYSISCPPSLTPFSPHSSLPSSFPLVGLSNPSFHCSLKVLCICVCERDRNRKRQHTCMHECVYSCVYIPVYVCMYICVHLCIWCREARGVEGVRGMVRKGLLGGGGPLLCWVWPSSL